MKLEHARQLLDMGIRMTRASWEDQSKFICTVDTSPTLYIVDTQQKLRLWDEVASQEDLDATDWEVVRVVKQ